MYNSKLIFFINNVFSMYIVNNMFPMYKKLMYKNKSNFQRRKIMIIDIIMDKEVALLLY
jgi:hypothetical protein